MDRSNGKVSSPSRRIIKAGQKGDQLYNARERWNLPTKKKFVSRNQGTATLSLRGTGDRSQTVNTQAKSLMMSPSSQVFQINQQAHSIAANSVHNTKRAALNYSRNTQRADQFESEITKSTHDNTFNRITKDTPHIPGGSFLPVGSVHS